MKPLAGKVALVSGASRGLGRAMALALAEAGANLALVARDASALSELQHAIVDAGGDAVSFVCDVTVESDVSRMATSVKERFGRIQILINNAGINIRKPITELTPADWRLVLDTNLTGAFLLCHSLVPLMVGQGYGRILNLTSIMSHVALAGRTAYAASKTGLLGFTKALALELAPEKITVNGISPGPVATAMNQPIIQDPQLNAQFIGRIPLGRWGEESEVARLAVYLCSEEAGFITGTDVLIDGGWTAQ